MGSALALGDGLLELHTFPVAEGVIEDQTLYAPLSWDKGQACTSKPAGIEMGVPTSEPYWGCLADRYSIPCSSYPVPYLWFNVRQAYTLT